MRNLVVLACICGVAYAQAQVYEALESSTQVTLENYENGSNLDNAEQSNTTPSFVYYDGQIESVTTDSIASERKGRYQSLPDQEIEESAPRGIGSTTCKEKNERYALPGSCDKYIECLNGTAEEKQCPDGLRYNPNVKFNVYPCQYPIDVPCLGRAALQPAQPTDACPHQFGYFKTGDSRNCSGFRNCVNGVGYDFTCPEGLAFSSDNYRCEWPDEVADCDAEAFLGFRCPEIPVSKELGPPAGYRTYRSPSDCQIYFICIDGKPRRLSCGGFSAFDELTESCVAADEVSACPVELRNHAKQSRDAEKQRLTAQAAFEKLRYAPRDFSEYITTAEPLYDPEQYNIENETQNNGVSASERNSLCKLRNTYLNVDGTCDSYIECRDYQATEMECPDGLNFNPDAQWPAYPCSYPQDVPCAGRRTSKPANPNANCPRQYGFFKSPLAKENDCGHYRLCNDGEAFEMYCPAGLAFNPDTARCDWAEYVPSCNAQNYIGFKCPQSSVDLSGNPIVTNHRYEDSCHFFYSCMSGNARILSCDNGFAFDAVKGRCEIEELVNCHSRSA